MEVKEILKSSKFILRIYEKYRYYTSALATIISPTLNSKLKWKRLFHRKLDLADPQRLNEKLMWLKLNVYNKSRLVKRCFDKYLVREYIETCGCAEILNTLYGVWESVDEIAWDTLPDKYVLKTSAGCGSHVFCYSKGKIDKDKAAMQLRKNLRSKQYLETSEMQSKVHKQYIICEKLLTNDSDDLPNDYKVYCFNGEPKYILTCFDRRKKLKYYFTDVDWNDYSAYRKKCEKSNERPSFIPKMVDYARRLSKPFPFVRVDFYFVDGKIIFGELTFTPGGCYLCGHSDEGLLKMGKELVILN